MNTDIIIIQNYWQTHYKIMLFNAFHEIFPHFKVLYLAEIARMREWRVLGEKLNFPYDVIFEGRLDDVNPLKAALAIHRRLNLYNPKIVIIGGYNYFFYWTAFFWARGKKKKLMVINESHFLDKPRSKIKESIKKFFVSKCDAALVDGTRHRDYTVRLGLESEKIFIKQGPGPVDVPFYKRQVSRFRSNKLKLCDKLGFSHKNFLFVGRFSPEKNILFLIRVYERLRKDGAEDWGLILIGNGPQRGEIENFVSKNKIKDIYLPGFKQQEELPLFYAISDVFVLPSVSEPWGLVVNEAMASSLPVLVSKRCGCYPDIVHDGKNGFSFDPRNEDELFSLMNNIVGGGYNLDVMGKASFEIIQEFTPDRAARMYVKAINFVLSRDD